MYNGNCFYSAYKNFADAASGGFANFASEFSQTVSDGVTNLYEAGTKVLKNNAQIMVSGLGGIQIAHKLSENGAAYLKECSDICQTVSSKLSDLVSSSKSAHCTSQKGA
ncbi:hypothetical protein [Candidatus Cyrtobacter comes]|nr:hypothetical protein [Candidatus Cyrtobacter comes]